MKFFRLQYVLSVIIISAVVAVPALAATNQPLHANKDNKKNNHIGLFDSVKMAHVSGTITAVGNSSFTLTEGNGSDAKTVTVDFDSKTQFMDFAPLSKGGQNHTASLKKTGSQNTKGKSGNSFMAPLVSSDIVVGASLSVSGKKNTDGSIQAELVHTMPVHIFVPRNSKSGLVHNAKGTTATSSSSHLK